MGVNYSKANKDTEINIIYNIENKESIELFGDEFVENNKDICTMIIDNKEYNIERFYDVNNYENNILKIKLKGINNITNIKFMFFRCSSVISLPDISKLNINNVKDMSFMFNGCSSLISLPDISKWNTNNVTSMHYMFSGCSSLISLPDISNWNTNNATNMSCMFLGCLSLSSLPDISNWNTNNTYIYEMFSGCFSILNIPNKL